VVAAGIPAPQPSHNAADIHTQWLTQHNQALGRNRADLGVSLQVADFAPMQTQKWG
jgi:hypothetical protein